MAIAWATNSADCPGFNNGTSKTFAVDCTNATPNGVLWVGASLPSTDLVTSVVYASTGTMTRAFAQVGKQGVFYYLYWLANPASGTNNVVITLSAGSNIQGASSAYSGVAQSGLPDATGFAGNANTTSIQTTITTVANNCWVVGYERGNTNPTAGAGYTIRAVNGTDGSSIGDSNAAIAAGVLYSMTCNQDAGGGIDFVLGSFPPPGAVATAVVHRLTMMGIGK